MITVPYYKMNYLLLNCKKQLWDLNLNYCFSFREYVKGQIQFPLTPGIYNRQLSLYKDVYLYLEEGRDVDKSSIAKVLKFFYEDLRDSFRSCKLDTSFYLDYEGIDDLFKVKFISNTLSPNEKILKLSEAILCDDEDVYLLIIGGDLYD